MSNASPGTAVVTGASSGIGAAYADRLAADGYDLLLIARDHDRLERVGARVRSATHRSIDLLVADLESDHEMAVVERRLADDASIAMLVNNAGFGAVAPLSETDPATIERLIRINAAVPSRLARAVAPRFAARGSGTIVNISSTVGIANENLNGVYAASKAFVLALSRSLLNELGGHGVRVQVVVPGPVRTAFWDKAGSAVGNLPADLVMDPDTLVGAALAGLAQGEFVTIPSLQDPALLDAWEAARRALVPALGGNVAAARYATA